jgi:two-component system response regulator (stage 0 sporulation protein F)
MSKILVIDDEDLVRTLLRTVLEMDGHTVMEAGDGRAGIALYREQRPDLVITDILLPELNGIETIIELTREFLNVKVIAISGLQGEPEIFSRARLLGARRTFQKPFNPKELLQAVRYELDH